MSFDYYWFSCLLDDAAHERFEPRFLEAKQRARLSTESQRALDSWESDLSQFDGGHSLSAEASRLIHPVMQAPCTITRVRICGVSSRPWYRNTVRPL